MAKANYVLFKGKSWGDMYYYVAPKIKKHTKVSYQILPHFIDFHHTESDAWREALNRLEVKKERLLKEITAARKALR